MTTLDRRRFLRGAVATTGGVLVGGSLEALLASAVSAAPPARFRVLGPVADLRDGIVRLHLPPGFQYRSFHDTDTAPDGIPNDPRPPVFLDDGTRLPGRHDGMAAFSGPDGNVWLIRNHELNNPAVGQPNPQNAFGPLDQAYDAHGLGGTTSILVTPFGEVLEAWTSLNGTMMNCAGGGMPWGAWITCEETVNGPDVGPDFTTPDEPVPGTAAWLHLRGSGWRPVEPCSDHARRAFPSRSGRLQSGRQRSVSHRGQLRVPVGLLPLSTAERPDGGRPHRRWRDAPDAQGRRSRRGAPRGGPDDRRDLPRRMG